MKTILAYLQEMESRGDEKAKRLLSQYKAKNALSNIKEYSIGKIFENRKDFETVCGLSGFDPDYFRSRAKKYIKAQYSAELLGSVFATHRKKLWRYNKS